jgi:threonine/homoserine/homoserine lactone efflux protein
MAELAGFLVVAAVVICTPGQDTALTIRNALAGGRRSGFATALGVSLGQGVWTIAAAAGLVAVLRASQPAFTALRLVGAAYLIYLGLLALLAAARRRAPSHVAGAGRATPGGSLRQGLISNLANPKMAVFFTSLLPQFAPGGGGSFWVMLALGLVFCALTLAWLCAYVVAVARAGDWLRRPRVRRVIEGVTGTVLVALGVRVATDSRQP